MVKRLRLQMRGNAASIIMADFVIDLVSPTITITSSTVSDGSASNDESISLLSRRVRLLPTLARVI